MNRDPGQECPFLAGSLFPSGCSLVWPKRLVRVQETGGSSPPIPTERYLLVSIQPIVDIQPINSGV